MPIQIELRAPSSPGRLYLLRDNQIDKSITFLSNNHKRQMYYSINIDNKIILDFDINHVLQSIEILIPVSSLPIKEMNLSEYPIISADIALIENITRHSNIETSIKAQTNLLNNVLFVVFGETKSITHLIELSESCLAIISEDVLLGFVIKAYEKA
jgi:hypothetical protein